MELYDVMRTTFAAFAAMIPLGRPVKQLTRLKRKPVEEIAVLERWDSPALGD